MEAIFEYKCQETLTEYM